jgi:YVTN family beta-propeller protein
MRRASALLVFSLLLALTGCGVLPPLTPEAPAGPESGLVGVSYRFAAVTTDPQNLPLSYRFHWGDGSSSDWSGCMPSGMPLVTAHSWREVGRYGVQVEARNAAGKVSDMSEPHFIGIQEQAGYPDTVVATIAVGGDPTDIAVLPGGEYIYVGNELEDCVTVVSVRKRAAVAQVECGSSAWLLAAKPDGQYVYVTNQYDGSVSVVRTSDNTVVATVGNVGSSPARCCFSPDGAFCYVADQNGGKVTVIRTRDNAVVARVGVGAIPRDVDCLPSGEYVYTANLAGSVSVMRTSDNTVVATVSPGFTPHRVRALPSGEYVYASEYHGSRMAVIRTRDNTLVASLDVGTPVCGMTTVNGGEYLYVATNGRGGSAAIIRTSDNTVVGFVRTGNTPLSVHSPADGSFVASCDRGPHTVTLIGRRGVE